jgi:outer membrane protein assembly factor BamB
MMGVKPRWLRNAVIGAGALLLLAGLGAVGWRVLRPSASMDRADSPYPARATVHAEWYGALPGTPLIVDGRLRVFVEKRRVWADSKVTAKHPLTPYWAYRRWPAQVVGVVEVAPSAPAQSPLVAIRWSDGAVTAVEARGGRVAWEKRIAPAQPDGYTGRRTGARTLYDPPGLYTASSPDGVPVLVVDGKDGAGGYDPATGERLWTHRGTCRTDGWTGETTYVSRCGDRLDIVDAASGRLLQTWTGTKPRPWGCVLGHSGCRMITTAGGANARLGRDGSVDPAPAARSTADLLVDNGYVEWHSNSHVGVIDASTGAYRWQRPLRGSVIGAEAGRVYVLTTGYHLVALDAATGVELSLVRLPAGRRWHPGYVYIRDGLVVLERLRGQPHSKDDNYYYSAQASAALVGA